MWLCIYCVTVCSSLGISRKPVAWRLAGAQVWHFVYIILSYLFLVNRAAIDQVPQNKFKGHLIQYTFDAINNAFMHLAFGPCRAGLLNMNYHQDAHHFLSNYIHPTLLLCMLQTSVSKTTFVVLVCIYVSNTTSFTIFTLRFYWQVLNPYPCNYYQYLALVDLFPLIFHSLSDQIRSGNHRLLLFSSGMTNGAWDYQLVVHKFC